jgi:hypothetical protein
MRRNARQSPKLRLRVAAFAGFFLLAATLLSLPAPAQEATTAKVSAPAEAPKGKSFKTPEDAVAQLYAAARRNDESALLVILGPNGKEIVEWSADPHERETQRQQFADKYDQMHRLMTEPDSTVALYVGAENWPLPIPLVEYKGAWYFDANLGVQEIRYRRIGRNEIQALEVCQALIDAEKEYHSTAHNYTVKFVSTSGSHDGLYWKTSASEKSPIGTYLAHAGTNGTGREPYYGYYYRVVLSGTDSFAVVAYPAEYRSSGVMSFLVGADGTAYEKDLGEKTATAAQQVSSFPADSSWKKVD